MEIGTVDIDSEIIYLSLTRVANNLLLLLFVAAVIYMADNIHDRQQIVEQ